MDGPLDSGGKTLANSEVREKNANYGFVRIYFIEFDKLERAMDI